MGKNYILKNICAHEQLQVEKLANNLVVEYLDCGLKLEDLVAVCNNAAMISCTAYIGDEKAFLSPLEVMKNLSLEEMATLLSRNKSEQGVETSINESFKEG